MAINFSSSNLTNNASSTYRLDKFNGVDYTTTPTNVDETRAIDMSNYLPDGVSLSKRYGYSLAMILRDKVLFSSTKLEIIEIWQYANHYLCWVRNEFESSITYYLLALDSITNVESVEKVYTNVPVKDTRKAFGIEFENRFFILANNSYFVIDKDLNCDIVASHNSYAPTLVKNLGQQGSSVIAQFIEPYNLLSTRYWVGLYFQGDLKQFIYYELNNYARNVFKINEVKINGNTFTYKLDNGADCNIQDENGNTINFNVKFVKNNNFVSYPFAKDKPVQMVLTFTDDKTVQNIPIEILIEEMDTGAWANITNCQFGIAYGAYGSVDRLFLSGNPDYPNVDYHTAEATYADEEWMDYTYFPDNSYQAIGTSDTAIIGYSLLSNGNMLVLKEAKNDKANIYIRSAEIQTTTETYSLYDTISGNTIPFEYTISTELFPITNAGITLDITKESKIINYDNKVIISTPKGLYYVNAESSTATQTFNAYELSYYIRDDLSNDTSVSEMITYKNSLYVLRRSKNGLKRVYVADSDRYSYVNGKLQYEWWVLDGIDAEKLYVFDNELYFLNQDRFYKFVENQYYDEEQIVAKDIQINGTTMSSEVFIDTQRERVIVDSNSSIFNKVRDNKTADVGYKEFIENTTIKFSNECKFDLYRSIINPTEFNPYPIHLKVKVKDKTDIFYAIQNNNLVVRAGKYEYRNCTVEYVFDEDGDYVLLHSNDITTCQDVLYKITISNTENMEFKVHTLYCLVNSKYYDIKECQLNNGIWHYVGETNDEITYFDVIGVDKTEVNFNIIELKLANEVVAINDDITFVDNVKFKTYAPVYSKWYSKYNDLGKIDTLKSVSNIYFVPMTRKGGMTRIGYRTVKNSTSYLSNQKNIVDFNDINFDDFAFDQMEFGRTYSSKKKIKNFAFIQMYMYSDETRDSSISMVAFKYKYTKNNKGVK